MYSFNIILIAMMGLGAELMQKQTWLALVQALCEPVADMHQRFTDYRNKVVFEMAVDYTKEKLQWGLRVAFNSAGIYIEDDSTVLPYEYAYTVDENQPSDFWLHLTSDTILAEEQDYLFSDLDLQEQNLFIVFVPNTMSALALPIGAFVKRFKTAGTVFKIEFYIYIL